MLNKDKIFGNGKNDLDSVINKLPYQTKMRIEAEVNEREKDIRTQKQINDYIKELKKDRKQERINNFKEGMRKRRQELVKKGVIQPEIRYNKKLVRSPIEELAQQSKINYIKELEDKQLKLKKGCILGKKDSFKIKDLKLKDIDSESAIQQFHSMSFSTCCFRNIRYFNNLFSLCP